MPPLEELVVQAESNIERSLNLAGSPLMQQAAIYEWLQEGGEHFGTFDTLALGGIANIDDDYAHERRLTEFVSKTLHPWNIIARNIELTAPLREKYGPIADRHEHFLSLLWKVHDHVEETVGPGTALHAEERRKLREGLVFEDSKQIWFSLVQALQHTMGERTDPQALPEMFGGLPVNEANIVKLVDRMALGGRMRTSLAMTRLENIRNLCFYDPTSIDSLLIAMIGAREKLGDDFDNLGIFRKTPYHDHTLRLGNLRDVFQAVKDGRLDPRTLVGEYRSHRHTDTIRFRDHDGTTVRDEIFDFQAPKRVVQPWKPLTTMYEVMERIIEHTFDAADERVRYQHEALVLYMTELSQRVATVAEQSALQFTLYQHGVKNGVAVYEETKELAEEYVQLPDNERFFRRGEQREPLIQLFTSRQHRAQVLFNEMWGKLTEAEQSRESPAYKMLGNNDRMKIGWLNLISLNARRLHESLKEYSEVIEGGSQPKEFEFHYAKGQFEAMNSYMRKAQ